MIFFLALLTVIYAQEGQGPGLERVELGTLRIYKDLKHVPDQYFNTPASGHILNAIQTSENILDAMEMEPIDENYIVLQGEKLIREIDLMNRKGMVKEEKKKSRGNVQFMFFSSGS